MSKKKDKYLDIRPILKIGAHYSILFGERSSGKSYAVLNYALEKYFEDGSELAIIRRFDGDFVGQNSARTYYESLMHNGLGENVVAKLSNNQYQGVEYYGGKYFLYSIDKDGKVVRSNKVVAHGFSLASAEHYKGSQFPHIRTIMLDEFIATRNYLTDEFILFTSIISTIVRDRNDVKIFMCGNSINIYNPYFREMGITNIKEMQKGEIQVYTYGNSDLRVAVMYTDAPNKDKASNVYFAFSNPSLKMITEGDWQLDIYPHCPCKFRPKDILFIYLIIFEGETFQAEIVMRDNMYFTYIHQKTTPIQDPDNDVIYSLEDDPRPNWHKYLTSPRTPLENKIVEFFRKNKVFYQDNMVGNAIDNYIQQCE